MGLEVVPIMEQHWEMELGGRKLEFVTGKLAKQAGGSVLVRYGDTAVLVTATMSSSLREGIDWFPLLCDFEERVSSIGKIPGGFPKREGRPSEQATLNSRLMDRPLRPLFPDGFRNDVQVVATTLSVDKDNSPEIPALIGASVALMISEIPFNGPIGAVRIGMLDGKYIVNPTVDETQKSRLSLVVAGTRDGVLMVEAAANEVTEAEMLEAIMFAHAEIRRIVEFQDVLVQKIGKVKRQVALYQADPEVATAVREYATDRLSSAIRTVDKLSREAKMDEAKQEAITHFEKVYGELFASRSKDIKTILDKVVKELVRAMITKEGIRPDGRALDEVRPISVEVGLLPRVHGSGLFTRGQTQVLTSVALGAPGEAQMLSGLSEGETKRYIHHYNFPSYSVGEVRPSRGPGRREIGHGALAERALIPVLPPVSEFPYTMRLVSEVLESNGSTSQASVCGSTLALMDAGVPIRKPVAGAAMGLVKHEGNFAILTDIQGIEDALGDMDFKVAGTEDGITAIQMDMKISGISREVFQKALAQAREARLFILKKMTDVIAAPRAELSPFAPRVITLEVDPERIKDIIGPGGKMIRKLTAELGVKIDIEDDGRVFILSVDGEAGRRAVLAIEQLTTDVVVGQIYVGRVTRLMNFGAFVEILPGKEGLVHISQLSADRVARVEDVVNTGDQITVKVMEIDRQGRVNLSRKEAMVATGEAGATPSGEGNGAQASEAPRRPAPAPSTFNRR